MQEKLVRFKTEKKFTIKINRNDPQSNPETLPEGLKQSSESSNDQIESSEKSDGENSGKSSKDEDKKNGKKRMKGNKQKSEPMLTNKRRSPHDIFTRTASCKNTTMVVNNEEMNDDKYMSREEQEEMLEMAKERRSNHSGNRSMTFFGINSKIKAHGLKREDEISTAPRSSSFVCLYDMVEWDERIRRKSSRFCVGFADTVGRRKVMEDTIVIFGQVGYDECVDLFAVFDGHGGDYVSRYACEMFPIFIEKRIRKNRLNPTLALTLALNDLNESIRQKDLEGGSTALVGLVVDNMCYIANIGDSRAVMKSGGVAKTITFDHTPDCPSERNRIEELGGKIKSYVTKNGKIVSRINDQIAVSRSLGDFQFSDFISAEPEIFEIDDLNNNYLILGCDGLWEQVSDEEAIIICDQYLNNEENLVEEVAQRLRDIAWHRGSTDNISVMIIRSLPDILDHVYKKKSRSRCIIN